MKIIDPKKTKERMDERLEMMHKLYSNSEVKHIFSPSEPKTNADRIRAMTDEELVNVVCCPYKLCANLDGKCNDCISSWLKQEAEQ